MEQFAGRAESASDLYALGATLIHLLTGTSPADLPQQNSRIEFANFVSVDLGLINWISKLTEPNINDRISTAREAITALENKQTLSPPIVKSKPTGSKIEIQKSASRLEINLPRRGGKSLRALYLVGLFIPFFFQIVQYINFAINANTYASWFYRIIIPLCLLTSISVIILPIFARTDLYFDRESFKIKWKLFGFCYKQKSGNTKLIKAIYQEEAKAALAPIGITIQLVKGKKLTTTPLATVERHWLVDEIADWLEFEV